MCWSKLMWIPNIFRDRIIAVISRLWVFYRGYRDPRQPAGIQNLQNDVFLDPGCCGSRSVHHWGLSTGIHNSQPGSRLPQAAAPIAAPDRDLTPFNLSLLFGQVTKVFALLYTVILFSVILISLNKLKEITGTKYDLLKVQFFGQKVQIL